MVRMTPESEWAIITGALLWLSGIFIGRWTADMWPHFYILAPNWHEPEITKKARRRLGKR